ncbi:MAG: hypothetical protein GF308_07680 [Candidatus Heimdallarchaeota archaeon]|nr:hypothetical protein [Candidatus Heimdallarchaeota archaeon]
MIEDILAYTSENKNKLVTKINKLKEEIDPIKVTSPWISYEPREKTSKEVGASDGSYNFIEYKGFVLYILAAKAFTHRNGEIFEEKAVDIDILHPYRYTTNRIQFYMSMLEKKVSLQLLKKNNIDLFLLDGSILGDLIRPAAFERAPKKADKQKVEEQYLAKISQSLQKNEFSRIISKDFIDEIYDKRGVKSIDMIIYLEYLENLLTLKHLLEYENIVVGISKRSQSTTYFPKSHTPDIALFEECCRSAGFSEPKAVKLDYLQNYKRRFPILDQEIREIPISLFYARFTHKSPVLKFEYVGEPSEKRAKEILDSLAMGIVEGYPYLLRKAHREVVITRKNIEQTARVLGIYEKTGREML